MDLTKAYEIVEYDTAIDHGNQLDKVIVTLSFVTFEEKIFVFSREKNPALTK